MGNTVYVTMKVMPQSPDKDLDAIQEAAEAKIKDYEGNLAKTETEPVAFGLKAINIVFSMDEDKGGTDDLEEDLETIDGVQSVQVTDVRRAIG